MINKYYSILVLLLLSTMVFAQPVTGNKDEDDQDDPYDKISYFMFGLNYLSNNVYLGRKDSTLIPYISPYIGYHFKSGIYGKAMISYAPIPGDGHIDLTTFEAGYDHSFGDHFNTGINVDKFLYNKNSLSVRANTKGSAGLYGQYSNDWLEPQISFDANVNSASTDYVMGLLLDHDFSLVSNTLNIIPSVSVYSGTQNYYNEYFKTRITKKDKTLKPKKVIGDASQFKPLDYELSTKVTYRITKWLFTFTPTYAIPVSPSTITLPAKTVTEKLSNSFFLEIDICHR